LAIETVFPWAAPGIEGTDAQQHWAGKGPAGTGPGSCPPRSEAVPGMQCCKRPRGLFKAECHCQLRLGG